MATEAAPPPSAAPARVLMPLIVPALVVGVGASLLLLAVSELAEELEHVLWHTLPQALGIGGWSAGWMVAVLTATGLAVGLVVWKVPGRAGPDPATTGLVDPPMPAGVVPGLLLASALALAGGVSLGPENPVTAANIALAYWLGRKIAPSSPAALWVSLGAAGTIGALFGTPVAAALILSELLATQAPDPRSAPSQPGPKPAPDPGRHPAVPAGGLWDRLFAPLVAAGAGGLTTTLITEPTFDLDLPAAPSPGFTGIAAAMIIASAGALLGLAAVYLLPYAHRVFHRLRHPVPMLALGGTALGLLGALGGQLTLFKGLDQVKELAAHPDSWSAGRLALMTGVKVLALVVATACGFRGGRIFPALFAGVALGLFAHAVVPEAQVTLAVTSGVLGILLAITRQGWLSLFTAAVLAADANVLPLLCVASLPAWLLVTGRPQMQLGADGTSLR